MVQYVVITEAVHDFGHPADALTAGGALTARLVLVEFNQSRNGFDDVRLLVHNNQSGRSQAGLSRYQRIEIHEYFLADAKRNNKINQSTELRTELSR